MRERNVLRVNAVEETAAYREAVAEILRNVLNDYRCTLAEIAETIDVSLGTISNAFNKKADLNPLFLNRLGKAYGATYMTPYVRLCGGIVQPLEGSTHDVLPLMLQTGAEIAQARSATSPAGVIETLRERLGYLPRLRKLYRDVGELICAIEQERDAA